MPHKSESKSGTEQVSDENLADELYAGFCLITMRTILNFYKKEDLKENTSPLLFRILMEYLFWYIAQTDCLNSKYKYLVIADIQKIYCEVTTDPDRNRKVRARIIKDHQQYSNAYAPEGNFFDTFPLISAVLQKKLKVDSFIAKRIPFVLVLEYNIWADEVDNLAITKSK
jgi:hypothetical protein